MKTLITFSLQAEAWLVKQCVNRGIQCLLQPRGVNRSQQGQGLPAPRLPVPLWQTKLPLSLPSAQSWRTIVIIAPLPHSAALLNTALLLCDSPVSSMLLNSIFCDKVGTRLFIFRNPAPEEIILIFLFLAICLVDNLLCCRQNLFLTNSTNVALLPSTVLPVSW